MSFAALLLSFSSKAKYEKYLVSKTESFELRNLLDSANKYFRTDLDLCFKYASQAENLSIALGNEKGILESNLNLIRYHSHKSNSDKIKTLKSKCEEILSQQSNPYLEAEILHALGTNFLIAGNQNLAIEEFYAALEINQKYGFVESEMKQLNNIGIILIEQEHFNQAIEYFTNLNGLADTLKHDRFYQFSMGNIGYCYYHKGEFEKALSYVTPTLSFAKKNKDYIGLCMTFAIQAQIYSGLKQNEKALELAEMAIKYSREQDFQIALIDGYRIKAEILFDQNKLTEAFNYVNKAFSLANESGSLRNFEKLLMIKYKCEKSLGRFTLADQTLLKLFHFNDSVKGIRVKNKIEEAKLYHEIEQNQKENEVLKLQQLQNELLIKNSQFYNGLLVLSIISIALLSAILFLFYKRKQKYNLELEQNIQLRTAELEKSNKELERFSFIASHDLKEPVRTISSFAQLLEETIEDNSLEKSKEYLAFISGNSKRVQNLIDDILQFAQINSQKIDREDNINLNELIAEIKDLDGGLISKTKAQIKYKDLPSIQANKSLILIIFKNIIENGIKYNDSNTPTIEIWHETLDEKTFIKFKDNGIGIKAEYQVEIFEMFKRLHDLRKYQGTGMGLAMCRKIMELYNGQVQVTSGLDKGSIFTLEFPRQMLFEFSNSKKVYENQEGALIN